MNTMRALLTLLLAASVTALPQAARHPKPAPSAPPETAVSATEWPIATLAVTGNHNYSSEQILKVSGLKIGQVAGKADFDAARDRLLATGAFDTVGYRFSAAETDRSKYAATFEVTEIAQVYPFLVEELPLTQAEANEWLARKEPLFTEKVPATVPMLARYSAHLEELLQKKGKGEKVIGKLTPEPGADLVVVFRPARLPAVAEVHFRGNTVIDTPTLQKAVSGAAIGAIYTQRRFEQILDSSLRPLYEAQGRVRVSFPKIEAAPARNVDGISVTAEIQEGPVYNLGKVTLTGAENEDALLAEGGFKSEEPANFTQIDAGIAEIVKRLRRDGYVHAAAKPERFLDDKKKIVDLTIHVTPGPRYTMGKLTIKGLDIQNEPFVRKLWILQPGKPFNGEYPDYFLKRLREDRYFDNLGKTSSKVVLDEKALIADVTLDFGPGTALPTIGPDSAKPRPRSRF
jgi:outer membrane protein insertion porin family